MATPPDLLLRVGAAWPLPGLGLLALPQEPAPALDAFALHTALSVGVAWPDGTRAPAHATVEEITRPDEPGAPMRGLLLDFSTVTPTVGAGVEIWLIEASPADFFG